MRGFADALDELDDHEDAESDGSSVASELDFDLDLDSLPLDARAPADDAGDAMTRRSKQEVDIPTARALSRRARRIVDDRGRPYR